MKVVIKVPARSELEVRCEMTGPLVVRIIDATLNERNFENDLTRALWKDLQSRGVQASSPEFPRTPAEFFTALAAPVQFNTLILIAHGTVTGRGLLARFHAWLDRTLRRAKAQRVKVAGLLCPWQLLGQVNADLKDKMVLLAVCGGHCPDSTWTWVTDQHLALLLVASRRSVTNKEVLGVFPRVLEELRVRQAVTPEDLDWAVKAHNIGNAFEVFSGVGIHHNAGKDL